MADKMVLDGRAEKNLKKLLLEEEVRIGALLKMTQETFLKELRILAEAGQTANGNHLSEFVTLGTVATYDKNKERYEKYLKEIKAAKKRMADGAFGFCKKCEDPIPLERLMVDPVAKDCVPCKEKIERKNHIPPGVGRRIVHSRSTQEEVRSIHPR